MTLYMENAANKNMVAGVAPSLSSASLFSADSLKFAILVSFSYLFISYWLIGLKTDQLVLTALFNLAYFSSRASRKFILGFSVFIIYWILFDYMKAFPNYRFSAVSIRELYGWEKALFGINYEGRLITPNEYFSLHHSTAVDIITGIAYLCWVPVPLAFACYLFFRNRRYFFYFALTFLLVNIIGFIGYYVYPAAPPWYVSQHGYSFNPATPGNTAGLSRFDAWLGAGVFDSLYSKSSNVFAAMPSLHASYLLVVLYYGIRMKMKYWNLLFAILLLGIWFSAVYNNHHYVLDLLAGIGCGLAGIALFQWWIKTRTGAQFINRLVSYTS